MAIYKTVDLFGNEQEKFVDKSINRVSLFNDYERFVEKFETKKTTDDCYTPPDVYQIVMDYVRANYNLAGKEIIRPFYPDGDFESIDYPANSVVIDNPPFSIIAKICRYYIDRGIPFFLFAPHLTLFSPDIDCTHIVVAGDITYENGAKVKTSFLSNMFGDAKIIGDAQLLQKFKELNESKKVKLPKYEYPNEVLTVSKVSWIVERGISININKSDVRHCSALESQKKHKKTIFGSGFLLSERAAAERAAAERAAAERAAAERAAAERAAAEKDNIIVWELSPKEINIIKSLG